MFASRARKRLSGVKGKFAFNDEYHIGDSIAKAHPSGTLLFSSSRLQRHDRKVHVQR